MVRNIASANRQIIFYFLIIQLLLFSNKGTLIDSDQIFLWWFILPIE